MKMTHMLCNVQPRPCPCNTDVLFVTTLMPSYAISLLDIRPKEVKIIYNVLYIYIYYIYSCIYYILTYNIQVYIYINKYLYIYIYIINVPVE